MLKKAGALKSQMDKIREHFNKTSGGVDERWFKIKDAEHGNEAKHIIRVLPPWGKSADGFFYATGALHYKFSIAGRDRALVCLEYAGKGRCPVCQFIAKMKNSDNAEEYKPLLAGWTTSIYPQKKYWVNIIDRTDPANPSPIKIFGTNMKFIQEVLDAEEEFGDITDPKTGHDIIAIKRGRGNKARYSYRVRSKESLIKFDPADMYDLNKECLEFMSYDQMVEILLDNYGSEVRELGMKFKSKGSSSTTEDERPIKNKKAKAKKKRVVEEDDEDGDLGEDEDIDLDELGEDDE